MKHPPKAAMALILAATLLAQGGCSRQPSVLYPKQQVAMQMPETLAPAKARTGPPPGPPPAPIAAIQPADQAGAADPGQPMDATAPLDDTAPVDTTMPIGSDEPQTRPPTQSDGLTSHANINLPKPIVIPQ
jgi:hypothetical protein